MQSVYNEIKKNYEIMQENMIYGDSLPFDELIGKIQKLNNQINLIDY